MKPTEWGVAVPSGARRGPQDPACTSTSTSTSASEGASDVAYALFTFPSLAVYEEYREGFGRDPDFVAADRIREESGCVRHYERSFLRPVLDGDIDA